MSWLDYLAAAGIAWLIAKPLTNILPTLSEPCPHDCDECNQFNREDHETR